MKELEQVGILEFQEGTALRPHLRQHRHARRLGCGEAVKMKFNSQTERSIFAAAFVAEFNTMHGYGWRSDNDETVEAWETRIASNAVDTALGVVDVFRRGVKDWTERNK